jgi:hypothetical protein
MRLLLCAVVGGLVMFLWGAFNHMVLPTSDMAMKSLPNEGPVLEAMKASIQEPGFYFFPGMNRNASKEEEAAWRAKYQAGPTGILVYHPQGSQPLSPRLLFTELLADILAAGVLAAVLAKLVATLASGARLGMLFGLFAWLSITVSYWNWYGFPAGYALAEAIDQVVGWMLAGLVIAWLLRRARA